VRPAERLARRLHFVDAERFAVRLGGAGARRRALADRRLAADQRRLAGVRARLAIAASTASTSWPSTSAMTCQP
jgi:hypothetical protein